MDPALIVVEYQDNGKKKNKGTRMAFVRHANPKQMPDKTMSRRGLRVSPSK